MADAATWATQIKPGVFISLIIIIAFLDVPMMIGILMAKSGRSKARNITVVNFFFVSYLAIGWMASNVLIGLQHFDNKTTPPGWDIIVVAYNIIISGGVVITLSIMLSILTETFVNLFTQTEEDETEETKSARKTKNLRFVTCLMKTLCVLLPWIFAIATTLSATDFGDNLDDCSIILSYVQIKILDVVAYYLPLGATLFTMILCIAFSFRSRDVGIPAWSYIGAVFFFNALHSPEMFFYSVKCYYATVDGHDGCFLTDSDTVNILQPLIILKALSFVAFPLCLLASKEFRRYYKNGICIFCQFTCCAAEGNRNNSNIPGE